MQENATSIAPASELKLELVWKPTVVDKLDTVFVLRPAFDESQQVQYSTIQYVQ